MTDNEIIKALECCTMNGLCDFCYLKSDKKDCQDRLHKDALDLINRQKAEVEHWKKIADTASEQLNFVSKDAHLLGLKIKTAYTEAIKKFAERVKENYKDYDPNIGAIGKKTLFNDVDNIVKEIEEGMITND